MHPQEIVKAYQSGENISSLLRTLSNSEHNSEEVIETAYDMQTGTYVAGLESPERLAYARDYGRAIAQSIQKFTQPESILEPGIGEGTTLSFLLDALPQRPEHIHGLDISWSRMACCRQFLQEKGYHDVFLSAASLFHLPYRDRSFDVVLTSHAVEPNGGSEATILSELYRVTSRFLVLLEPCFEIATPQGQDRMQRLGYCRDLPGHAETLGMKVVHHQRFEMCINELNPTAITVIEKDRDAPSAIPQLACPKFGDPLADYGDSLFSEDSIRAYPKIQGIPCLRPENGIIASAYEKYRNVTQ